MTTYDDKYVVATFAGQFLGSHFGFASIWWLFWGFRLVSA